MWDEVWTGKKKKKVSHSGKTIHGDLQSPHRSFFLPSTPHLPQMPEEETPARLHPPQTVRPPRTSRPIDGPSSPSQRLQWQCDKRARTSARSESTRLLRKEVTSELQGRGRVGITANEDVCHLSRWQPFHCHCCPRSEIQWRCERSGGLWVVKTSADRRIFQCPMAEGWESKENNWYGHMWREKIKNQLILMTFNKLKKWLVQIKPIAKFHYPLFLSCCYFLTAKFDLI